MSLGRLCYDLKSYYELLMYFRKVNKLTQGCDLNYDCCREIFYVLQNEKGKVYEAV